MNVFKFWEFVFMFIFFYGWKIRCRSILGIGIEWFFYKIKIFYNFEVFIWVNNLCRFLVWK